MIVVTDDVVVDVDSLVVVVVGLQQYPWPLIISQAKRGSEVQMSSHSMNASTPSEHFGCSTTRPVVDDPDEVVLLSSVSSVVVIEEASVADWVVVVVTGLQQ